MITLTENARKAIDRFIHKYGAPVVGLRVLVAGGGCAGLQYGLRLEKQVDGDDTVVDCDSFKVLVDPISVSLLQGATIDFIETLEGSGSKFNNPNANARCDCGQSFST